MRRVTNHRSCEAEARRLSHENSELALEIAARNGQLEALQATLRLLTRELEDAIHKEAVAVAKLTLCQKDAVSMQQSIEDAECHVTMSEREQAHSQQEIRLLQVCYHSFICGI